ncbi:MAG: ParB N-terminal domain-containing protein, partial [Candidatus Pacebacteria bacterium]|nr:ParB N-terminal domain-containing protein [Candidatus Paceibacterota bacterium]
MKNKLMAIGVLKRADYNPRTMPDSEMASLKKSILAFGFVEPIIVNEHPDRYGVVIGGHQRLTAIESLVAAGTIPNGLVKDEGTLSYLV